MWASKTVVDRSEEGDDGDGDGEAGGRIMAVMVEIFEEPSVLPSRFNSDALSVWLAAASSSSCVRAPTPDTPMHTLWAIHLVISKGLRLHPCQLLLCTENM
jgi:hypothetical protein